MSRHEHDVSSKETADICRFSLKFPSTCIKKLSVQKEKNKHKGIQHRYEYCVNQECVSDPITVDGIRKVLISKEQHRVTLLIMKRKQHLACTLCPKSLVHLYILSNFKIAFLRILIRLNQFILDCLIKNQPKFLEKISNYKNLFISFYRK